MNFKRLAFFKIKRNFATLEVLPLILPFVRGVVWEGNSACGLLGGMFLNQISVLDDSRRWLFRLVNKPLTWATSGFFTWYAKPLAPFPKVFSADAKFLRQFGFTHLILMLEHKMLKIIF